MWHRSRSALALLASLAALTATALAAAPAAAATSPVITDCVARGALSRAYSIAQLHHALASLTAVEREYTSCPDVINRALAAAVSGRVQPSGTGSGGSGSFLPTPVLILLILLVLAALAFGILAVRRRRGGDG